MTQWSKEDLKEMCGDDIIGQLAFLSGCFKHKMINDKVVPDGWIIPDELLRKFAELIVRECVEVLRMVPYDCDGPEFGDEVVYQKAVKKHFGVLE